MKVVARDGYSSDCGRIGHLSGTAGFAGLRSPCFTSVPYHLAISSTVRSRIPFRKITPGQYRADSMHCVQLGLTLSHFECQKSELAAGVRLGRRGAEAVCLCSFVYAGAYSLYLCLRDGTCPTIGRHISVFRRLRTRLEFLSSTAKVT